MDINDLILSEINKRPDRAPEFRRDGVWIRCPNPKHSNGQESTPSLRIRLEAQSGFEPGSAWCFGCKWRGHWNDIAEMLKLRKTRAADERPSSLGFSFEEDRVILPDLNTMQRWPESQDWRTITGKTLKLLDARLTYYKGRLSLYLPVIVHGDYVGGIYAKMAAKSNLTSSQQKTYINTEGHWSEVNLYGYDIAAKRKGPLWVVEGPRDTAKIIQLGGRVVGLIGSHVSNEKAALIEALDPPLLLIATDPDDAGKGAAKALKHKLSMIPQERIHFPEGRDPANLTPKSYNRYMEEIAA